MEELLASPYHDFAYTYVSECLEWVKHRNHITARQVMAIDKIRQSIYSHLTDEDDIDMSQSQGL